MELKELEYFVTIADKRTLTAASKALYISQPGLTKFIQKLESNEGLYFFERIGKQYQLTQEGKRFYTYAKKVLTLTNELNADLKSYKKSEIGNIIIGIPSLRANACLDIILKEFKNSYPMVNVEVVVKESKTLEKLLHDGSIDLLFSIQNNKLENLTYETIAKEKMCVIVGENSPLNEIGKLHNGLTINDIKNENLLLQNSNQRTTERIINLFNKKQISPKISEATNLIVASTLATNGYGVSFLSDNLIKHYSLDHNGNYYPLLDDEELYFSVAYRSSFLLNDYHKHFIQLMKNIYQ